MGGVVCAGVTAGYNGTAVVHGVDLTVAPGEWVAVIGPNGSGKSTLLRAVARTIPHGGSVTIGRDDTSRLSPREVARRVAVVPQHPVIPAGTVVFDYVMLGRTPYIPYFGSERAEDVRRVRAVIWRLDLDELATRRMEALSGGERQRAVLGRALAQDAGVLLLDEPTTALDIGHQQQVLELVDELRAEAGIAVVSAVHDLTLAAQYADRLVLLNGGVIAAQGAAAHVLTPEVLTRYYGAGVTVLHDDAGRPIVAPQRAVGEQAVPDVVSWR